MRVDGDALVFSLFLLLLLRLTDRPPPLFLSHSYAVDSLVLLLQSVISGPAYKEIGRGGYVNGLTIAAYVGMLTGALFWGLSADMIGRRYAFNLSLLISSVTAIVAGAMPNWAGLGVFIALVGFGAGGNLIMDTTVFLEYLPSEKQWVLTFLACWWGLGQAVTGFIAWGFLCTFALVLLSLVVMMKKRERCSL